MRSAQEPPFERVLVETNWYDGPASGIALVDGVAHRFEVCFDEDGDVGSTYELTPIDDQTLALEIEQFQIFVRWNDRFERGETTTETHPAHGGIDPRFDELEQLLAAARAHASNGLKSRRMRGALRARDIESRYALDGPSYDMQWNTNLEAQSGTTCARGGR